MLFIIVALLYKQLCGTLIYHEDPLKHVFNIISYLRDGMT